ncbi:MAG: HypC/HybG/HupF family hydrogenase formation chaperone [Lachnospiraceae bacterium]|nr:HypC/HybG/HupF family hydrogenase formation chaperone [Lachnospiraceae bacterium]MDD7178363.1 HypC/HybG/HupF family hydrogenase formation chaperone [bacterium]MDY5516042.1 HypC/HybG/HupF family hydrogenase formation chaperone [Lachnospiraceae bacterium]
MCVALPGKVVEIYEKDALVDFNGNRVRAIAGLVPIAVGDYVLVHAGCILQKLSAGEAQDMIDLFEELEDAQ